MSVPTTPPAARGQRVARGVLVAAGVLLLALGGWVLYGTVAPTRYGGLLLWLAGAVVAHDAVLAPLVVGASLLSRRAGRRVPPAVIAIVQAGVVVGVVFTLVVVPEIVAKTLGPKNDTVLPFDYGTRLAVLWLVVALLTATAVAGYLVRTRRQNVRPSTTQA